MHDLSTHGFWSTSGNFTLGNISVSARKERLAVTFCIMMQDSQNVPTGSETEVLLMYATQGTADRSRRELSTILQMHSHSLHSPILPCARDRCGSDSRNHYPNRMHSAPNFLPTTHTSPPSTTGRSMTSDHHRDHALS
jgi:hypothetical protein